MKRTFSRKRISAHQRLRSGLDHNLGLPSIQKAQLQPLQRLIDPFEPFPSGYYPDWLGVKPAGVLAIAALCQRSTTYSVDNPYYQALDLLNGPTLMSRQHVLRIDQSDRILLSECANDMFVPAGNSQQRVSGESLGANLLEGRPGLSLQAEPLGTSEVSISFGTDRLRAGAGACELMCDQAIQFELGCLLLSKAMQCQVSFANGSSSGPTI